MLIWDDYKIFIDNVFDEASSIRLAKQHLLALLGQRDEVKHAILMRMKMVINIAMVIWLYRKVSEPPRSVLLNCSSIFQMAMVAHADRWSRGQSVRIPPSACIPERRR